MAVVPCPRRLRGDLVAIQPLPSNATYEHFHWFAERLETGYARERRRETARSFGFGDWQTLVGHAAWSEAKPPEDGARMRYLAHGIPKLPPTNAHTPGVLRSTLEGVLQAAYLRAEAEHLPRGVADLLTDGQVGSESDGCRMRAERDAFLATAPRGTGHPDRHAPSTASCSRR